MCTKLFHRFYLFEKYLPTTPELEPLISDLKAENVHMRGSRYGDRLSVCPLNNHKAIGFLSNNSPDSLENTKVPRQYSILGHYWPASEIHLNIGITHVFSYINICRVPMMLFEHEAAADRPSVQTTSEGSGKC